MRSLRAQQSPAADGDMRLHSGARVAVLGGGPAGSFFALFLSRMAERAGLQLSVDILEPRDFDAAGPAGCNMCGGIVSESLVQSLASEGIDLPPGVVQRCIETYVLHTPEGSVRISPRLAERRIAALHRGGGPRGAHGVDWRSLDGYLLDQAQSRGARVVRDRVKAVAFVEGRPQIVPAAGAPAAYDLLAVAVGVNSPALKLFEGLEGDYHPPRTAKASVCEIPVGRGAVAESLGSSMHVFLLDMPGVEFAALIPKGDCVTACLVGESVGRSTMQAFLASPSVSDCFPPGWQPPEGCCQCGPRLNVSGALHPYGDRIVYVGDCGVTRLYKDGIGAAYRTAKAAAATAVFQGISGAAFDGQFRRVCMAIERDNQIGRAIFARARWLQKSPRLRQALLRQVSAEQQTGTGGCPFSEALWDIFTGSAPYREVLRRVLTPRVALRLAGSVNPFAARGGKAAPAPEQPAGREGDDGASLGRRFGDRDVIVREGETGDHMYVVLEGEVEVYRTRGETHTRLAVLREGAIFGEMALCDPDVRSASVRALGPARVLTVDRTAFLRRVHEDPSLALRVVEQLCRRIRAMDDELARDVPPAV